MLVSIPVFSVAWKVKPTNNVAHELLILMTEFAVGGVFSVNNKVLLKYEICHWTFFFSDKKSNGKYKT